MEIVIRETERNTFQHFWEDGIYERGAKAAEKSIRRRKILISISDKLVSNKHATKNTIAEHSILRNVASLESDLKEFVTRKILINNPIDDSYRFKVPLFEKWLRGRGIEDIIATFSDLDAALRERQREEELKIQPLEIRNLVANWGVYKGQIISDDRVRDWLNQFGGINEQRLMFNLLKGIKFYSNTYIRKKLGEVHDVVKRGLVQVIDQKKKKRSDIWVSYLDNPAKSGADLARLYVDESSIYIGNVIEKGRLKDLDEINEIKGLLFIDDFVGTGESATKYLKEVDEMISDIVISKNIKLVFASITAFKEGWKKVEKTVENLNMPVTIHLCEGFDESNQCFSENSIIFSDRQQREEAEKIAKHYGNIIEKNCPLGYGNLEMAVIFERGCPNNSLPILWSESINPKWTPLFKRL